jgi:hypothetical protein
LPLKRNIGYEDVEDETPSRHKHVRTGENDRAGEEGIRGDGDEGTRELLNSSGAGHREQIEAQEILDEMPVDE